jgi:hypothetical protein
MSFIAVPTCISYAKERKKPDPSKVFTFLLKSSKHFNAIWDNIMHGNIHIEAVPKSYVEFPKLFGMEFGFYSYPQVATIHAFFFPGSFSSLPTATNVTVHAKKMTPGDDVAFLFCPTRLHGTSTRLTYTTRKPAQCDRM